MLSMTLPLRTLSLVRPAVFSTSSASWTSRSNLATPRMLQSEHVYPTDYLAKHTKTNICPSCCRLILMGNVTQSRHFASRSRFTKEKDYYEILELSRKANQVQIKAAYFRLSKKYHPDINKSTDAEAKFAEISQAYEVLGKPHSRHMYDRGIFDTAQHGRDVRDSNVHPDGWKDHRTGFRAHRGPPRRGRTSIYNYDAWLKEHYTETIEKRAQEKTFYDIFEKDRRASSAEEAERERLSQSVANYLVPVACVVALIAVYMTSSSDIYRQMLREGAKKSQGLKREQQSSKNG